MASKFICVLAQSGHPSSSRNSHDDAPQVLLQPHLINASHFTLSWLPSADLQTSTMRASNFGLSRPPSASPDSHNYCLQICIFRAFKCISKLAQTQPPRASLNSHNYRVLVRRITASEYISKSTWSLCGETGEWAHHQLSARPPIASEENPSERADLPQGA